MHVIRLCTCDNVTYREDYLYPKCCRESHTCNKGYVNNEMSLTTVLKDDKNISRENQVTYKHQCKVLLRHLPPDQTSRTQFPYSLLDQVQENLRLLSDIKIRWYWTAFLLSWSRVKFYIPQLQLSLPLLIFIYDSRFPI